MSSVIEDYAREVAEEEVRNHAVETARRFFENGAGFEVVKNSLSILSEVELKEIYESVMAQKGFYVVRA